MGCDVCFQMPHHSQEQEIVQMVWVCNMLPRLNASTKNIQLECRTWQQGQSGGLCFVATLRTYFDIRVYGLKPEASSLVQLCFNLYLVLGEFSGDTCRDSESRWKVDLGESSESRQICLAVQWAINSWHRYPSHLDHSKDQLVLISNFSSCLHSSHKALYWPWTNYIILLLVVWVILEGTNK